MKKVLRALLAWLDRKFPDKVEITMVEYLTQKAQLDIIQNLLKAHDEWAKKTSERLEKAEIAINNLNVANGLGALQEKMKVGVLHR